MPAKGPYDAGHKVKPLTDKERITLLEVQLREVRARIIVLTTTLDELLTILLEE